MSSVFRQKKTEIEIPALNTKNKTNLRSGERTRNRVCTPISRAATERDRNDSMRRNRLKQPLHAINKITKITEQILVIIEDITEVQLTHRHMRSPLPRAFAGVGGGDLVTEGVLEDEEEDFVLGVEPEVGDGEVFTLVGVYFLVGFQEDRLAVGSHVVVAEGELVDGHADALVLEIREEECLVAIHAFGEATLGEVRGEAGDETFVSEFFHDVIAADADAVTVHGVAEHFGFVVLVGEPREFL